MGKRPRISRSDLPNQERVALLNKFDAAFGAFQRLQERRRACSDEAEKRRINTLLNGYRSEFQQLFAQLKLVDLGCKNNMEALFNNYCESYNVYFGRKLGNYVRDVLQSEEIKKITHLIHTVKNDEERAKLQEYIDNKPQSELNALIKLAVRNYQQNRSDYNRAKTNDFLAYFHKKIECKPYTKASEDEIKATRADFNGFFQIPGVEQLKRYNPYSEAYRDFSRRPSRSRIDISPFSYDFSRSKAWQACCRTTMLSSIEMPLREAMARQGVPPELLPKMKVADFGRILFNEYGKEPYHPGRGNILALEDVVPGLDSRHKAFFWKYNAIPTPEAQKKFCDSLLKHGVSQEYIDVLLPSILNEGRPNPKVDRKKFKGVIPFFSLHHKWAIQYLGGKANSQKNYVGIAEFKSVDDWSNDTPQHDIWHEADAVIRKAHGELGNGDQLYENVLAGDEQDSDFIEYLVDTRYDNQNDGKYWTVSMGYKAEDNIRGEIKDFAITNEKAKSPAKKEKNIDKRYRPAAYAR
ncbi:unknown [Azospirillum sp. CAG:260]|jgi:hypothetical protein|uniref:Uncharacterized protein n=1 Tax=Candidatus Scatocola faecipullorum TaxID=2840917 RepID=A0A9D1SBC5_9PROT|nr:MAG: hypothetical protein DBX42_05050 [Azospirillum sp.]CDB39643.1 unknown [Azospirillum sp. CAG:260]HIU53841.1 hypothetical protein [Candidatus Scatocola faecipullorum]